MNVMVDLLLSDPLGWAQKLLCATNANRTVSWLLTYVCTNDVDGFHAIRPFDSVEEFESTTSNRSP